MIASIKKQVFTSAVGDIPIPSPLNVKKMPAKTPVTELVQVFSVWFKNITAKFIISTPSKQLMLRYERLSVKDAVIKFIMIATIKPITMPIKPLILSLIDVP